MVKFPPIFITTIKPMWYVYILKCSDNSYYTGCTNNLKERLTRHNKGQVNYTKDKLQIIKEATEQGVNKTLEKYGVYPATYYSWKKKLESMGEAGFSQRHLTS